MRDTVEAIYEKGILRPLRPLVGIGENSRVRVTVTVDEPSQPLEKCVGTLGEEDAREMRAIIYEEFDKVDPDEWK